MDELPGQLQVAIFGVGKYQKVGLIPILVLSGS